HARSCFVSSLRRPPSAPLFPYTTLFRSFLAHLDQRAAPVDAHVRRARRLAVPLDGAADRFDQAIGLRGVAAGIVVCTTTSTTLRSEEHTSELQSRENLVCRLLLEKKKHD